MSEFGWFGFRIVKKARGNAPAVSHAFRDERGRSLCGKVAFGPDPYYFRRRSRTRTCATCSSIWSMQYPPARSSGA